MDKSLAGLIGAVTVLAAAVPSQPAAAAPTLDAAMQASSYADLLRPIPNALVLLKASETAQADAQGEGPVSEGQATVQNVQYHHHHHHHRYWRRRFHHHHHHHHHHNRYYGY